MLVRNDVADILVVSRVLFDTVVAEGVTMTMKNTVKKNSKFIHSFIWHSFKQDGHNFVHLKTYMGGFRPSSNLRELQCCAKRSNA